MAPSNSVALRVRDRLMAGEHVSWDEVLTWAASDDMDLRGAAYDALMTVPRIIDGSVDGRKANQFMLNYLVSVIETDDSQQAKVFAMPRYIAAHEIVRFYRHLHGMPPVPEQDLKYLRDELARLYIQGDEKQKRVVVDGALEHIFEEASCRPDFDDWKDNPLLARGIEEAMEWINGRPST